LDTSSPIKTKEQFVAEVVQQLVLGRFQDLERMSGGVRLSAQELARAVADYGRTLVMPPDIGPLPDFRPILGMHPPAWSVWVPLFTREEGRSDLMLQLTLVYNTSGGYKVELDNLLVP
jgi:hypothetical protein